MKRGDPVRTPSATPRVRFDRGELAGAFGDIGLDLPLIAGMIIASDLDPASVLLVFGAMQVLSGVCHGMPLAVQPLKAVAALVIAGRYASPLIYGAGLGIGVFMLVLTLTGLTGRLVRFTPLCVVRGIQLGLGLKLGLLALVNYIPSAGPVGWILALCSGTIVAVLLGSRRYPPALLIVGLGVVYACLFTLDVGALAGSFRLAGPVLHRPSASDVVEGFLLIGLAQIPLSLANSIIATADLAEKRFPGRVSARRIGLSYSLMNIAAPFASGIPTCHGSGGLVGHYAFGARTGGSLVIYGGLFLVTGAFFSDGFGAMVKAFPLPVLGVILLVESLGLVALARDLIDRRYDFCVALVTGILAAVVPYGFLVGTVVGVILARWRNAADLKIWPDFSWLRSFDRERNQAAD